MLMEQRNKMAMWVENGVEVYASRYDTYLKIGILINPFYPGATYLYASTASGLLPEPGTRNTAVYPNAPS